MTARLLRIMPPEALVRSRRRAIDPATLRTVAAMLEDIESRGDTAVRECAVRFGDATAAGIPLHDRASLARALDRLPKAPRDVLERAASSIATFARAQRACMTDMEVRVGGGRAGHTCLPVQSVGCYAPGGRFPLPSSVLMTAITARAAGVSSVWVASPRPTDATLAAAAIAGADGLIAIGGAHAVAALALGLCGVPARDMIVGPGNKWVTAAKFLVSDRVGIDMLAGPSELVVLADSTADPALIATDLLAQAEHDEDAVPILVTTDPSLPEKVETCLHIQLETLPTRSTAIAALTNGFASVALDINSAITSCNSLAPEHLEVQAINAASVAAQIRNAGTVFIGSASAEVLGDYGSGPNHVLPTGRTSRYRAGLSVFTFLRPRTWIRNEDGPEQTAALADAAAFARMEGLEGHARAAEARM